LPYDRADYRDKWRIERAAETVRSSLGLDQLSVLSPHDLLERLGVELFELRDLIPDDELALRRARSINFDGCASHHPETMRPLIILNCGRPARRRTATLMEELAHLLLRHQPARIEVDPRLGILRRSYDREQEHEAYDMGAALLLPKQRIQRDVKERQLGLGQIAEAHTCSEELVAFRVRRLRLWNRYVSYSHAAS
jgi:Zn-dependent peptidase ImmA (M78 family)